MSELSTMILYSLASGSTIFMGGVASRLFENFPNCLLKDSITNTLSAFGGGIILAAVAFVLAPEGTHVLNMFPMMILFILGAISFAYLESYIEEKGNSMSQLFAMLLDFIPESIALGAVFATNHKLGVLLAIFIALQNFPEAFNSYIDFRKSGFTSKKTLIILFYMSFLGVIFSLFGKFMLGDSPQMTASVMIYASGGIIYLIFQDIAPMCKMKKNWIPSIGASVGFMIGMISHKILM